MKTFFKGPFTSFLGRTSLHLVYIQPYSKFHLPTKIFQDPLVNARSRFFLEPPPPLLKFAGCTPATLDRLAMEVNGRFSRLKELESLFGFLLQVDNIAFTNMEDDELGQGSATFCT